MAGSIDLNAAAAPTNVPVNPVITATFNTDVDATTAIATNVTLTEDYDNVSIALTITASGKVVTITPNANLANGALYKLAITAGLKATSGESLTALTRSFTTVGSFLPAGVFAYWNFDGNANDQTGAYNAASGGITDITYVAGRNAASGQAAKFNGTTSLIEIPNGDALNNTSDFSLSFWVKEDTTGKRDQFVMGLAGWFGFQFEINSNVYGTQKGQCKLAAQYSLSNGTSASQDLWFDGSGTTKDNGGWQGFTFCKDLNSGNGTGVNGLLAQQWAHVVCTYDHTTKIGTIYINGQEMKAQDFNLYGTTHPLYLATGLKYAGNSGNKSFVFGFIQDKVSPTIPDSWADYTNHANGHFQGLLDDVAIYHSVLSPSIITLMYNSGRP
ncbi:MAG: LamG-like jellyroll fold domain-containing protein [Bacteroidota bacterium]|nr:LamG-like jellyroll fold domain-containing protein [Bacteroidota bacterium]